ncbi:MAG: hypothetical protein CFH41_00350 [Alphaproteobacteria bacterium MarineAlpha11_Bin1]|nr:MAG: hypothetical protein CFH41_00350 [Alphaproteobacteria bacterium MarineAlpha11_Bin1]
MIKWLTNRAQASELTTIEIGVFNPIPQALYLCRGGL